MFRTVPLSIIRRFFTVNTAMVYVIQVCWQLASRIRREMQFRPDPASKLSANLYDIYHCYVYSEKLLMMDRRTVRKTCRVLFQKQIWEISASSWFYYKDLSRCTVTWTLYFNYKISDRTRIYIYICMYVSYVPSCLTPTVRKIDILEGINICNIFIDKINNKKINFATPEGPYTFKIK